MKRKMETKNKLQEQLTSTELSLKDKEEECSILTSKRDDLLVEIRFKQENLKLR